MSNGFSKRNASSDRIPACNLLPIISRRSCLLNFTARLSVFEKNFCDYVKDKKILLMFVRMESVEDYFRVSIGDDPIKNPNVSWQVGQVIQDGRLGDITITHIIEDLSGYYTVGETSIKVFANIKGENKLFRKYKGNLKMQLIPKL